MSTQKERFKREKVYLVAGLVVVFCAVGYYRFFGGSSGAPAIPSTPPSAVATVVNHLSPPAIEPSPPSGSKEEDRLPLSRGVARDIFAPVRQTEAGDKGKASEKPSESRVPLILNGIIYGDVKPLVVINGQFYRMGDSVGGFKIVRVRSKDVLLKSEDQEIALRIGDYERK